MEIHEIRYFMALCRTLNFTKAADACHVSQPALTRAIQKMEDELGGLLFSRERGNTHLTELGRLVRPHLEDVIARTDAAKETAGRFLSLDNAPLRLGVMCTIGPVRFVSFLSEFRIQNPGIEVTLVESTPDLLTESLTRGETDLALLARPGGFDSPLRAIPLYRERFVVACSAGHRFASQAAVPVSALNGESYLARVNCEHQDVLRETCRSHGAQLRRSYNSEREDWILTMVAAGMGVCLLPEYSNTVPGVVGRPMVDPVVEREVCLVTMAGRRWSKPIEAFVSALRHYRWPEPSALAEVTRPAA